MNIKKEILKEIANELRKNKYNVKRHDDIVFVTLANNDLTVIKFVDNCNILCTVPIGVDIITIKSSFASKKYEFKIHQPKNANIIIDIKDPDFITKFINEFDNTVNKRTHESISKSFVCTWE